MPHRKRRFKPTLQKPKIIEGQADQISDKPMQRDNRHDKWHYVWVATTYITGAFLAMIGLVPTLAGGFLNDVSPFWIFIFIYLASVVWLCNILWLVSGWINKWRPLNTKFRKVMVTVLAIVVIGFTSPYYIGVFMRYQGNIEMPKYVNNSTQVLVHYGTRANDFFWTEKTVGDLKQKSSVALNVNGQDIFSVYTDGRQLFMDAKVFAGYSNDVVPDYTTIGSTTNFSITMAG